VGRDTWFYAVAVGRSTGVFLSYAEAKEQIDGYSGFRMKKFENYEEAEEYVAFNQVYSSDEEAESEEEEPEPEKWLYAVAVGRRVGVFTDREEAVSQVYGYSGFKMKKFLDCAEAQEYISLNRVDIGAEEEKSEEPEEQDTWYYAVAVGRRTGIYTHHEDAMA
jgi:viroplasmin and RNaseH domain-containing protein